MIDLKDAQIMRNFNRYLGYVRNIFAFILLPWYSGETEARE